MNYRKILDNAYVSNVVVLDSNTIIKGNAFLDGIGMIFGSVIEGDVNFDVYLQRIHNIHWWRDIP